METKKICLVKSFFLIIGKLVIRKKLVNTLNLKEKVVFIVLKVKILFATKSYSNI